MERNPTLYAKMFASVSRDRWVSLSIFGRVATWAGEVLFLKGGSPGPIRSTQPTRNELLKLTPMVYHHKRPHSALGYLTPMEFQRKTFS